MTPPSRCWLEVDLDAVRQNVHLLRMRSGVPLIVVVKADAYGVGAVAVSRALGVPFNDASAAHEAPWGLCVSSLDEASQLRHAGCLGRILVLSPLLPEELQRARALRVRPALHRPEEIERWAAIGSSCEPQPYHLAIDTGMSRAGVPWTALSPVQETLRATPPEGVFTHFHSADDDSDSRDQQDARFLEAFRNLGDALPPTVLRHSDNSAAILGRTGSSPGSLARPGLAVYGGVSNDSVPLRQVVHVRARVVDIREISPGETVSYGATWTATVPTRIATVAVGYADGYRRHLSNRGEVLLRGVRCPVVGRVTMDLTMIDITAVEATGEPVHCGEVVTLIGRDGDQLLSVEAVAAAGELSPYELLIGLNLRVPAVYLGSSCPFDSP